MKLLRLFILTALLSSGFAWSQSSKYKCMLQISNYMGEGAYVVVSLIKPDGTYDKTLYVMGDDKRWYDSLKEWHKHQSKKKDNLSAITGASVTGGDRSVTTFSIEDSKFNKGYKLRFESAVENQKYHIHDVEIPLSDAGIADKASGTGYIRYVKLIKQ
jgi:L-rhamnose isomerase